MKINFVMLIIMCFFFGCKKNTTNKLPNQIEFEQLKNVEALRYKIEHYYITNETLPLNEKELINYYKDSINYLFENESNSIGKIHYIPVIQNKKAVEYFLVTGNNVIKSIEPKEVSKFLQEKVTIC